MINRVILRTVGFDTCAEQDPILFESNPIVSSSANLRNKKYLPRRRKTSMLLLHIQRCKPMHDSAAEYSLPQIFTWHSRSPETEQIRSNRE